VVLMSEKAHLADPHITVGLVAGDGGAAFWPLLTNIMRSREFLLTGERISASKPSSWDWLAGRLLATS
jgi:enoyl-CoA hydratase